MKKVSIAPTPAQRRLIEAETSVLLKQLMQGDPPQVEAYLSHVTSLQQVREVLTALTLAVRALYLNR